MSHRRTRSFVVIAATALVTAAASRTLLADTFSPWTQYQADAAHTGHIPASINPAAIHPLWSKSAAQLGANFLIADAASDAQHVFVTSRLATGDFQLLALDRNTGTPAWSSPAISSYASEVSAPSAANGEVYVHSYGHSGTSGGNSSQYPRILGYDAATGTPNIDSTHSGQWSSGSRPTVDGSQVFAAGGYYGGLDAYNAASGAHQWFANVNQQYGWIPAADANHVYVYMGPASASPGPGIGTLYAFNRSNGSPAFSIQNPTDSFTLYNGTVTLGSQDDALTITHGPNFLTPPLAITSFDLANHSVRWTATGNFTGSIAVDHNVIFANDGPKVDLLDEATGALLNSWTAPGNASLTGNLALTDNLILAHTSSATYAIDRSSLSTVWSTNTAGNLAIDSDILYVSNSTTLSAFALVPEPSSLTLLACCTALPLLHRRRR